MVNCKREPKINRKNFKRNLAEPFSMKSLQKNVSIIPPPRVNVYEIKCCPPTMFRKLLLRDDLPICRSFKKSKSLGEILQWKTPPQNLDYCYYLPVFFDGLCEHENPYKLFARAAIRDMLIRAPKKVINVIPHLIIPIKRALNTKNPEIITATLCVIQHLINTDDRIGECLVPYYRQILPIFNLFYNKNVNLGDGVDFSPNGQPGDVIQSTLKLMEMFGGPHAYVNIKYMVPLFESCS